MSKTEGDTEKKFAVLLDTSKQEMLNPNLGYKKIVKKLRNRYNCDINKQEITLKRLKEVDMVILGGPRQPFNAQEL